MKNREPIEISWIHTWYSCIYTSLNADSYFRIVMHFDPFCIHMIALPDNNYRYMFQIILFECQNMCILMNCVWLIIRFILCIHVFSHAEWQGRTRPSHCPASFHCFVLRPSSFTHGIALRGQLKMPSEIEIPVVEDFNFMNIMSLITVIQFKYQLSNMFNYDQL